MTATRFCPTASSGPLHIGHLLPAYGAMLHARNHGGKFFIKAEYKYSLEEPSVHVPESHRYDGPRWRMFVENLRLMRRLWPGVKIVTSVETGDLLRVLYGEDVELSAALDAVLGVDCIVRGQEWNPLYAEALVGKKDADIFARLHAEHASALEKLLGRKVEHFYVPILLDERGEKISKRQARQELTLAWLMERGLTPADFLAYACRHLGWDGESDLERFQANFDLASVAEAVTVRHDPSLLPAIDAGKYLDSLMADADRERGGSVTHVYRYVSSPESAEAGETRS